MQRVSLHAAPHYLSVTEIAAHFRETHAAFAFEDQLWLTDDTMDAR